MPFPELVPFAANHVVAEGVYRGPACKGARGSFKRSWDKGDTEVPFEEYSVCGGVKRQAEGC